MYALWLKFLTSIAAESYKKDGQVIASFFEDKSRLQAAEKFLMENPITR